jgi:hypothetical protein
MVDSGDVLSVGHRVLRCRRNLQNEEKRFFEDTLAMSERIARRRPDMHSPSSAEGNALEDAAASLDVRLKTLRDALKSITCPKSGPP